MKLNRRKNALRSTTFGILQKIIAILLPFLVRTVTIKILGVEYLGLNSLFSSILNILSITELGFGTAMVYSMYKPIAEDDEDSIRALLNLYKKIYRIIGIVVLTAGLLVMPALKFLIKGDHPADINLYVLFVIFLSNNVIGYFFFAYKNSLLAAHQRNDISSKITILIQIILYSVQIAVLFLFKNYYVYIIFLPLSTLANNLCVQIVTKKLYPQYFAKGQVDAESKKQIKKQIYALFLHKIGYVIQSSIDNIAISAFMGLTLLGKYNNYYYMITAIQGFLTIIKQSLVAGIGNSILLETKEDNKKQFYRYLFMLAWIVGWCATCFMCLYQPFMRVWVKPENMLSISVVICLVALFYVSEMRGVVGLYKDALGMWHEDRFKPIIVSIFNAIGTIICAHYGWFEGIIISTIISYALVGLPIETFVFYKYYMEEKQFKYYLKQIFYLFVSVLAIVPTYFICKLIPLTGIPQIVVNLIICLVVPNITMLVCYFKVPEFKQSISFIKNFKTKRENVDENQTNA